MPVIKQSLDTPENNMPIMSNGSTIIDSNSRGNTSSLYLSGATLALRKGGLLCQVDVGNGVSASAQSAFYCTHSITHQLKTMSSGGIYWEVLAEAAATSGYLGGQVGLVAHGSENSAGEKNRLDTQRCSFIVQMSSSGTAKCEIFHDTVKLNSATGMTTAGANLVQGDVINFAVRYDGKVFVGINGTWVSNGVGVGNPATGANQLGTLRIDPDNEGRSMFHYTPACGWHSSHKFHFNFGSDGSFDGSKTSGNNTDANTQGNFFNTVPTGYVRLCSNNIGDSVKSGHNTYNIAPTVTDNDVGDHFGLKPDLIGDGANPKTFAHGMDFTPDMIWAKGDDKTGSGDAGAFHIYNRIKGTGGNTDGKELRIDRPYGENYNTENKGDITDVTSSNLKIEGTTSTENFNTNTKNNRFWMWNMGGQPTADNNNSYETFNTANSGFGSVTQTVTVSGGVFVLSPGTGSSGTHANPALTMVRSINTIDASRFVQYIFNQDDASNNGHPLAIKDAAGNNYTTGVVYEIGGSSVTYSNWSNTSTFNAGAGNRKLKFTIDVNAPNTGLRYYCTVHGNGMGNTITTVEGNTMDNNSVIIDGVLQTNYIPPGAPTHYPTRMSVNTKAGMSCVTYSGTNHTGTHIKIPHGLGTIPQMVWIKRLDAGTAAAGDWSMYHHKILQPATAYPFSASSAAVTIAKQAQSTYPATRNLSLSAESNSSDAAEDSEVWSDTMPGRHIITLPASGSTNATQTNTQGSTYMMWSFVEVPGFSMFGRYEGNINNYAMVSPFVYCGFKPQFIMIKKYTAVANDVSEWNLFDYTGFSNNYNYRMGWRSNSTTKYQNFSIGSDQNNLGHVFSNGFKIGVHKDASSAEALNRGSINDADGSDYVFMAFAERPFKYSTAVGTLGAWPNI